MPGGVDMHAHIAGPKVNVARKMRPEDKRKAPVVRRTPLTRSGTTGSVPSTFATGYLYAGLGYTTAFDAAIPPLGARHAHEEFHDTPVIDKGFFVLFGNNHYVLQQIGGKRAREAAGASSPGCSTRPRRTASSWSTPAASRCGSRAGGNVHGSRRRRRAFRRHAAADHRRHWPRRRWTSACRTRSTSTATTSACPATGRRRSDTMQALEGRRAHLTHIQFHSYGGDADDQGTFRSQVPSWPTTSTPTRT